MDRRQFLQNAGVSASTVSVTSAAAVLSGQQFAKAAPSERVRVGVVGGGGRALSLNRTFSANPNVEVVTIADLDPGRLAVAVEEVAKRQGKRPSAVQDFRKLIDDSSLDALVVGTPDHWHAIPTIMACQAGLDVYVEKPDGHNIVEGQRMVAAMRKHRRVVQMGSQHRSTERMKSAFEFIRTGALGRCLAARAWESTRQGSIGNPPDSNPPDGIDYDFWLGAAPRRPFNPRRFHGHWRWFYDYGTGDLGNDGVHRLDMAVAALNVACETQGDPQLGMPSRIMAAGGKWYFDDAQEFPDTLQVTYEYQTGTDSPKILTYEMRIWAPYSMDSHGEGALVYGDRGYIVIGNRGWKAYGSGNRLIKEQSGDSFEGPHVQDFIDCIKSRKKPSCDLETVGHPASVLCHSGNIAARVGRQLVFDAPVEPTGISPIGGIAGRSYPGPAEMVAWAGHR